MENRAYSLLEIREVADDERVIRGMATTPAPDRMGDIVEPLGVEFANPVKLLHQHDHRSPVGHVTFGKPTKSGIPFTAKIVKAAEPASLKERVDLAWAEIKHGLVSAVSIGFRSLERSMMDDGGIRFLRSEIVELSLVTIPANAEATITSIKAYDTELRAASGPSSRPASRVTSTRVKPKEGAMSKKTTAERIAELEAAIAAKNAQMDEIDETVAADGVTKSAEQREEYEALGDEVKDLLAELKDAKAREQRMALTARTVNGGNAADATDSRNHRAPVTVKSPDLPKGAMFARYVGALANCKGNRYEAAEFVKHRFPDTPVLEQMLRMPSDLVEKTAVAAGTTTDSTWAEPLVQYTNMASEFIDYLRPLTVMGRMQGFRRVPFKVKVPRQTGGASVNWVGEGKVKPLTSLAFDSITLDHNKVAGIIPLTEELVRFSSPSAEELVRADLAAAIAQFLDDAFLDPANAATDVSPASITYGVSPITSTGTTAAAFRADVKSMFAAMLAANQQVSSGYWVMTQGQALGFSLMRNALDQPEFPNITMTGGSLLGFPVLTTENLAASTGSPADGYPITFVMPAEVLLADEGGVMIDMSREASLQMETTPDSPATASTVLVSLWQHNMVAIKAERFITWKARRATAAGLIAGAKYSD